MSPRLAPVLVATLALVAVVACGTATTGPASPVSPISPAPADRPALTPVPAPEAVPTPTPSENAGDVDGWGPGPQLTVEFPREDLVDVTLEDPAAKAWRIVVTGTGPLADDRLELVVEAADVAPVITVTEIQQGDVVDVMDLSGYVDGTAAAGGCHETLDVCVDSSRFRLPEDGNGLFTVRLEMPGADASLLVTGGTAGWPGEPFILGPWSDTEPFPWGEG